MEKKSTPTNKSFTSRLLSPFRSMGCIREPKVKEDMTPPPVPKEDKVDHHVEENNSGINNNVTEAEDHTKEVDENVMTKEVGSQLEESKFDESSSGQGKKSEEALIPDIQEEKKSESGETSETLLKGR